MSTQMGIFPRVLWSNDSFALSAEWGASGDEPGVTFPGAGAAEEEKNPHPRQT